MTGQFQLPKGMHNACISIDKTTASSDSSDIEGGGPITISTTVHVKL